MNQTDDWRTRIKVLVHDIYGSHQISHEMWKIEDAVRYFTLERGEDGKYPPVGTWCFTRRRRRKLRTRYIVMEVMSEWGAVKPTNAEIVYHKSHRRWSIHIDSQPVNDGYLTIKAAKASFLKHPLDRLAAEAEAAV